MRDAFPTAERVTGASEGVAGFGANGFVFDGGLGDRLEKRDGGGEDLQELGHGGELSWGEPVEEFVGLLAIHGILRLARHPILRPLVRLAWLMAPT